MSRRSVAVLDVRSSEVVALVGERGVNNTVIFRAHKSEKYSGYQGKRFFDEKELKEAIFRAVSAVEKVVGERLRELYIGVPGEFTKVVPQEQEIGFPKKRKISAKDTQTLYDNGRKEEKGYRFILATSMIYVTSDNRRVVDPVGLSSDALTGMLSYYFCTEYFAKTMEQIFSEMKIELHYLPAEHAMANYLIPSERRDECALFLDVGQMASTICLVLGNGMLAQRNIWVGKAQIAAYIAERFSLPLDGALVLLNRANLYAKSNAGVYEFVYHDVSYEIDLNLLVDTVKEGLDALCEQVGDFIDGPASDIVDYKPLYITGEGLFEIRGALEHVSKRINRVCEQLAPQLPYYNKPSMSSRVALLDMAYENRRRGGFWYRILNGFGG